MTKGGYLQIALVVVLAAIVWLWPVDDQADLALESGIQRALVTFALARTLNGVISVAQGTEIALQPAGVGMTVAIGELLDPINDLVERFSWVMLVAASSLGSQRLLLELSAWWGVSALLTLATLFWVTTRFQPAPQYRHLATRVLLLALLLRLALPVTLMLNQWVHENFLSDRYTEASVAVEQTSEELKELKLDQAETGILDRVFDLPDVPNVDEIATMATELTRRLIDLIVLFVVETILLPLIFVVLFWKALKLLFRPPPRMPSSEERSE